MKLTIVQIVFFSFITSSVFAQKVTVQSPNQKISIVLFSEQNTDAGEWYVKASYNNNGKVSAILKRQSVLFHLARNEKIAKGSARVCSSFLGSCGRSEQCPKSNLLFWQPFHVRCGPFLLVCVSSWTCC